MKLPLSKIVRVILVLAVVAGGVGLLRFAARSVFEVRGSVPNIPFPQGTVESFRRYDLQRDLDPRLQLTFGGLESSQTEKTLEMPYALADETLRAQCLAKGWTDLPLSMTMRFELAAAGTQFYRTASGDLVQITLRALSETRVTSRTLRVPIGQVPLISDGQSVQRRSKIASQAAAMSVRDLLPLPLSGLCVGLPFYTQLTVRGTGSTFLMLTLADGWTLKTAQKELLRKARQASWLEDPLRAEALALARHVTETAKLGEPSHFFVFENLGASVRAYCDEQTGETILCYRITDDEMYTSQTERTTHP
ncbi:MAG: hypothetical protein RSD41_05770 [Kiritimatiellia bacterium]